MNMTYIPPTPPATPFKKGDVVDVMGRDHDVEGEAVIAWVGTKTVRTKDGRRWRIDGWWMGSQGRFYPFPWIKKQDEYQCECSNDDCDGWFGLAAPGSPCPLCGKPVEPSQLDPA